MEMGCHCSSGRPTIAIEAEEHPFVSRRLSILAPSCKLSSADSVSGEIRVVIGVTGEDEDEDDVEQSESVDGIDKVGDTGESASASGFWTTTTSTGSEAAVGISASKTSASACSRSSPNSEDRYAMNGRYLSMGSAYGCVRTNSLGDGGSDNYYQHDM